MLVIVRLIDSCTFESKMEIRRLSEFHQKKAQQELNEDPNRRLEDLKQIKDWLKKQYHLNVREEDQYLLTFLRGCKFSIQQTKSKLDLFYSARSLMPEFFLDRDPFSPGIQAVLCAGAVFQLPQVEGSTEPVTIMCTYSVCRPEIISLTDLLKVVLMLIEILLNEDDNMIISGLQIVVDLNGFDYKYLLQATPTRSKNYMLCLQKAYPIRLKASYCINAPDIFEKLYLIVKPFMTEKFKNRLYVYSENSINEFAKTIGRGNLPKDYGGEGVSAAQLAADTKIKIEQHRNWFLEDSIFCSNEKLRPAYSKRDPSSILGIEGSFRKLNVD